jgi:hypothetical protein
MTTRQTPVRSIRIGPRRRHGRPLDPLAPPPDALTAAAMDDRGEAEQLVADLLALVEVGLLTPQADPCGPVRYAPAGED